ncbi:MAG: ATP synthase F0 subunit B [Calditrichaeota bacterium]|nr:MAG: ATP synthase F0 subunit B [Calditrichota bacterium]
MELMTPHTGTIFWTAVTFVFLAFVLYKMAWDPILKMLEDREMKIKESLQAAEIARQNARKSDEERQRVIESAKREAQEIILAGRKTAETIRDEILQKAQAAITADKERVQRQIEESKEAALQTIRALAVELSMAATEKLIAKKLSPEEHRQIIQESLVKMEKFN